MANSVQVMSERNQLGQYDYYKIVVNSEVVYLALLYYNTGECRLYRGRVNGWEPTPMTPRQVRHQVLSITFHHMYLKSIIDYDRWSKLVDMLLYSSWSLDRQAGLCDS